MRSSIHRVVRVVAASGLLAAALPAVGLADASRSSESSTSRGSSGAPGASSRSGASTGARGSVGWRWTSAGWSRSGVPGLRSFGPRAPRPPGAEGPSEGPRPWQPTTIPGEPARLVLAVDPPGASVYLDGDWMGRCADFVDPAAPLEVPPGSHELVFGHPDRRARFLRLELEPEEERRLEIRLEPENR